MRVSFCKASVPASFNRLCGQSGRHANCPMPLACPLRSQMLDPCGHYRNRRQPSLAQVPLPALLHFRASLINGPHKPVLGRHWLLLQLKGRHRFFFFR